MNETELSKRKQRAETEPLVITKTPEGHRIFSAANPSKFYLVRQDNGRVICNCLDFEKNSLDPNWRCKHVLAVESEGSPSNAEIDEERKAIQAEASGEILPETTPRSRLLIKRSISPDGRIDSVSLEMDLELNGDPRAVIKAKAIDALQLEAEIASVFLTSHQLQKQLNGSPNSNGNGLPHLPEPGAGAVEARLQSIGVMPGKWGPRHFINVDVQGRFAKLFGTPKQIAAAIQSAGYNFSDAAVADGVSLNIPCRVITKQNGQYLNVDRVMPLR